MVVSAPADCLTNAYCGRGLAATYGVDIADDFEPTERIADSVAALKGGDADIAVAFSNSPYVDDPDLVVLEDDRAMLAADNIVPVFRRSLLTLHGTAIADALDDLSALLTPEAVQGLDGAVGGGQTPDEAARNWLDEAAPTTSDVEPAPGRPIVVGGASFVESQALAAVIVGYLSDRGFPSQVEIFSGGRAAGVDALANGDVDVLPEYAASLLEYLNGFRGEATARTAPTVSRLGEYLDLIGAQAATPAPAQSTNVFLTTRAISQARGLRALSDLATSGLPVVPTTSPIPSAGPAELGVLVRAVGHQLAVGSTGAEVRDLQERLTQLGFEVEVTGTYDQPTVAAVRSFQAQHGLAPDGVVGPSTEAALAAPEPAGSAEPVEPGDPGVASPPATSGDNKVIYLTFDDGPSVTYTRQILDLLEQYDATATFFELGENASAHPELTRAIVAAGHALANHTWDHADMRTLSRTALDNEINHTTRTLEKISGAKIRCIRPPYGALSDEARAAITRAGLSMHLWDIDPQDWNRPGVRAIVDNVLGNAHTGAVNLMHDGGGNRSQSVKALAQILPALAKKGYRFEALPDC